MYLPNMVLITTKVLLMVLAKLPIPAVVPKPTIPKIITYSTKPWPASSLCSRPRKFRIWLVIPNLLLCLTPGWGGRGRADIRYSLEKICTSGTRQFSKAPHARDSVPDLSLGARPLFFKAHMHPKYGKFLHRRGKVSD